MIKSLIFLLFFQQIITQSQVTLTQPPLIQTNTYTIRKTSSSITNLATNISYMQTYNNTPLVFTSIVNMNTFTVGSVVAFTKSVTTITKTYFTFQYVHTCFIGVTPCLFTNIDIDYLVYDFPTYPFVQMLQQSILIDPIITTTNQYYQIKYLQSLSSTNTYSLNCMLSGFNALAVIGQPQLYVSTVFNSYSSYYLNVKFKNITIVNLYILRILIDETVMNSLNTGISSLSCTTGMIYHYSDPNVVQSNPSPDFLPFAMFFGASGFGDWNISLSRLPYIFNNTKPRIQANIGYVLFLTASCPSNQLYVSTQNLCYSLSSAFYYQATPATLQPCPYSCYQCVGPLSTQCKSCVIGWNRVLSSGRCICISGFYDPGAPQCKNCTEAISGCKTCSSATNCLTCLSGCNAIGFSPIYCDCPGMVQKNFSYNCPTSFYFDYTINSCTCLPQTYFNTTAKLCFPCSLGCYICVKSAFYCLVCIDSYVLINNVCVYFYTSYALLGQVSFYNNPQIRCIRWYNGNCIQKCKYFFYQSNCYNKCPLGTFNISFPWLTCQLCQISCNYCYNYTICFQCASNYYYFNTTILSCSPCSSSCITCSSASSCSKCETGYLLINNQTCELPSIAAADCGINCTFCLIAQHCLKCSIPYYLNQSAQQCLTCSKQLGLQLWGDGCHEICGDGISINDECDDGNALSGDGCSSKCYIQYQFNCKKINGKSYCWSQNISIQWSIYSKIGANQIMINLQSSNYNLKLPLIQFECGFNFSLNKRYSQGRNQIIILSYQQSIILMYYQGNTKLLDYYAGNLSKISCNIIINKDNNYSITVNSFPSFLYINYNSLLQSINSGNSLKSIVKVCLYLTLISTFLTILPLSSFSCLRFSIFLLLAYMDYAHIPINAFSQYQALQTMFFIPQSNTTKDLINFSSSYMITILWRLAVFYIGFGLWLEWGVNFILRICKSMQWKMLIKLLTNINQNKFFGYQNLYSSYEPAIWCLITSTFQNINQASSLLIFLVILHICFIVASKIHFWFTFDQLEKLFPQLTHYLVIQQIQNLSIALLFISKSDKGSYLSFLTILFAVYPLISINRNNMSPPKSDRNHITIQMICWQLRVTYIFYMIIQFLKLIYMWSSNFSMTESSYQSLGQSLGLTIGLLTSFVVILGQISSIIIHSIRICEIKNQNKSVIPSNEQIDIQTADANSHAQ